MTRISWLAPVSLAALLAACSGAGPDSDGDYLSDSFEIGIGTNPDILDSDGDGFDDALELLSYFNPLDAEDHPYEGAYPRMPTPHHSPVADWEIDGEGWDEGDVSRDWSTDDIDDGEGSDQFGERLNLHDFYGQVVLIDVAAEWCGPCRTAAPEAEAEYNDLKSNGFMAINLLLDGLSQDEAPDVDRWIDDLDLTFAIVGDQQQEVAGNYIEAEGGSFSIPNFSVIGRDGTVEAKYDVGSPDYGLIEDLMQEDPPEVEWPLPENAEEIRAELGIVTLDSDYVIPGEHAPEGAQSAGASGGGASGGSFDAPYGGSGSTFDAPYGGVACSASGDESGAGLLGLALLGIGLAAFRRRD